MLPSPLKFDLLDNISDSGLEARQYFDNTADNPCKHCAQASIEGYELIRKSQLDMLLYLGV